MKKILFVAPNLHHGGAEAVLVKIINNLNIEKYNIKLVLIKKEGSHLSKLPNSIEVIDLKSKKTIFAVFKLVKTINREKPDYVFSIIGQVNLILAMLKVILFRNIYFIGRENAVYSEWIYKSKSVKNLLFSLCYKFFLKRLDVVIVQSVFMANQVIHYFKVDPNNIRVLNNPIDNTLEEDYITNKPDFSINSKPEIKKMLAVGRIEEVKNYKEMIEILKKLPNNYHLDILGEGNKKNEIQSLIESNNLQNRINLRGFVDDTRKYFEESDLLLLTSTRESFPNVVLEANACGLFVVSYDMPGGIKEIIENGKNGSIVEMGNQEAFVEKILEQTKNSKTLKEVEVIKQTVSKYSMEKFINKIEKIFDDK